MADKPETSDEFVRNERSMDSLHLLNLFVRVAEHQSFTRVGKQLGLSSSAVGKAICRLESHYGTRLFHRSTRTLTLTPEGAMFLERCRRILTEYECAELELAQTREAPRGKLRISLPAEDLITRPVLSTFMRLYPEIQLDLSFTNRLVDIIAEGFDVVLRAGPLGDSGLMSRKLLDYRRILVASPTYLSQFGEPRCPEDLIHHTCLMSRHETSGRILPWPISKKGMSLDTFVTPKILVNTLEPLIHFLDQGFGIGCVPDFAVRPWLQNGRLVPVLTECVSDIGTFRLLWPSGRQISPKLRVFIDHMSQQLSRYGEAETDVSDLRPS